jgi:mercuric ion transport protein
MPLSLTTVPDYKIGRGIVMSKAENEISNNALSGEQQKREKKSWKTILAGGLALLTCPCHVVLLIPLLAGTAFGSVLSQYTGVLTAGLVVLFGLSIWYLMRNVRL